MLYNENCNTVPYCQESQYIGAKVIKALPMSAEERKVYFPNIKPATEEPDGYKVIYPDGYESWSPKSVFDEAYRPTNGMTFGLAIEAMKKGFKVARAGWNGKGMWITISQPPIKNLPADHFWNEHANKFAEENGGSAEVLPTLIMKTADGKILMGWLASQTDILAEDWQIVE